MHSTPLTDRTFLYHDSCPRCGSSDNRAVYDDGYMKCFSSGCDYYAYAEEPPTKRRGKRSLMSSFIDGEASAIKSRGLSEDTCRLWGYTVGRYNDEPVQVANYKNDTGSVVAQKVRFKDKTFKCLGDFKQASLYGKWRPVNSYKMLVITEGEIDALSVSQAQDNKWPVVSLPGGAGSAVQSIKKDYDWVCQFETIVLMFDQDGPGRQASQSVALELPPGRARIAELPLGYKDANDLLKAGKIDLIVRAIWNAKPFRPDGIVAAEDMLSAVLKTENMNGVPYPFECINKFTHGLRPRELVTVTAGSGIGKSTFVREIAYSLIRQGEKVGYIALEESIQRTLLGLIGIDINRPLFSSSENEAEITEAFKNVFSPGSLYLYDHFGSCDADGLLNKIRFLAKGLDCTYIIFDHISMLISGIADGDERRLIDNVMTKLRSIVQETGIGMIMISHLKRADGKVGHEDGAKISLSQLRGSAAIGQLSDIAIGLERNQQSSSPNIVNVRIMKNRPIGLTGICGQLEYSNDTGRLSEVDSATKNLRGENTEEDTGDIF